MALRFGSPRSSPSRCSSSAFDGGGTLPPRLIMDCGSGSVKVGWCGEAAPRQDIPTCMAQVRRSNKLFLGDMCYSVPEYFCHRPFNSGLLQDPELLRDLWDTLFTNLRIEPQNIALTVTEALLTPLAMRRTLAQIVFEDFGFQYLLVCPSQAVVPYAFLGLHWGQYDICNPSQDCETDVPPG
eukprot:GHVT01032912.1.p1 GENE.GHVT01032912.1~~GHVT01032912.1.p1  ORF type:complete len:182 (+),score=11.31 GHVT01032912.1:1705-2250(+)